MKKNLARLPQCKKHFSFIDVPNIFYGGLTVEAADGTRLPKKGGTGASLLPNPTNGVLSNKTMIFSDPQNNAFRNYMDKQMKSKGLKNNYIDTWEYAHIGDGNLHCSSHSINSCRPRKVK